MKIIVSHSNCDLDAFSSMVAAQLLFPDAFICITGASDEVVLRFIHDHKEKFNFIREKNVILSEIDFIIMVDNTNISRTGKIGKYIKQNDNLQVVCYDHHNEKIDEKRFVYYRHENTGSCVSVILNELIERNVEITPFYASVLALGIYEDTGSFLNINTTQKDFSAMAFLLSMGASLTLIKKYVKPQFTADQIQLMNELINNIERIDILDVPIYFLTINYKDSKQSISMLIQYIRQSENLPCIFCLAKHDNQILIVGRSDYSFLPVNKVLRTFGGGGHPSSGSATIHNIDTNSIQTILYEIIEKFVRSFGTVKEFMNYQVETIDSDSSILNAIRILTNQNIGALIVVKNSKHIGIITKKDISKALLQKIENSSVESFISTDLYTINPNASIFKAQELMLEKDIGRLPVVENGNLIGIISRRDLLFAQNKIKNSEDPSYFDNVSAKMKREIKQEVLNEIYKIGIMADTVQAKAYIVGGFVRDLLMNRENFDFDIVLEYDAIEFAKILNNKFGYNYVSFPKFKTAIVQIPVLGKIDLVTARSEYYRKPGETPTVSTSSIRNDLYRRDFTINSMAVQINQSEFGKLIDFFNARRDLQLGIVRVLNNMSFSDDPTRILRAIRFEQRFSFKIDQKTFFLMQKAITNNSLNLVAVERIQQEIIKACYETIPSQFFIRLHELGVLKKIHVNLTFDQEKTSFFNEAFRRIQWFKESFFNENIQEWVIYLSILTLNLSLRAKTKISIKLKFSKTLLKAYDQYHDFYLNYYNKLQEITSNGEISEILFQYSVETLLVLLITIPDEIIKNKILQFITNWRFINTELSGKDLILIGFPKGKTIGTIKKLLLKLKIDGLLNTKEDEYNFLSNYKMGENNLANDSKILR